MAMKIILISCILASGFMIYTNKWIQKKMYGFIVWYIINILLCSYALFLEIRG